MATLKSASGESIQVDDNSPTLDPAEELGVPFGCRAGVCSTCVVKVLEGMENLDGRTENEEALGLEENERCMCQATIKGGDVVIDW